MLRQVSQAIARKTTRRGLFNRGASVAFGALAGAAAGTLARGGDGAEAGSFTVCAFPGPPCPCNTCQANGVCAKPCIILTQWYVTGCWVTGSVTCCDCDCQGQDNISWCGCGSDYHNNPDLCPDGNASG